MLAIFGILLATIAIAATTHNHEKTKSGLNVPAENAISRTKVPYSAIFGTIDRDGKEFANGSFGEISNVSFNLPVFEISQLYPKMKAGKHTISVWCNNFEEDTTIYNLIITVIANQNGKITEKSTG
ncbi:MAG TPA: hypothetical protein VKL21_08315 [Candidatus Methanoperedens sp.]|nr:hypothetical protein [Candidatus Methanoperedens sp.]